MSEIHDRLAVILDPRDYAEWLNESERPPLHLLRILQADDLVIDPVQVETVVRNQSHRNWGSLVRSCSRWRHSGVGWDGKSADRDKGLPQHLHSLKVP